MINLTGLLKKIGTPSLLALAALSLQACFSVDGQLVVKAPSLDALQLHGDDGLVTIPAGSHEIELNVAKDEKDTSELVIKDLNRKFRLYLPSQDQISAMIDPITVAPEKSGQPVSIWISRQTDESTDHYHIEISSAQTRGETLAILNFDYKGSTDGFNEKSNSFLASFQDVYRSQRAVLIPIDGGLMEPANTVVNHSAQVYLAPWIYARYSTVSWNLPDSGDSLEDKLKALSSQPVIDFIGLTHAGDDFWRLDAGKRLNLFKEHQIRFVYTEGCGSAGYITSALDQYGAAVAIGHRDTSASPFFVFPLVHSWIYGMSAYNAARAGWLEGEFYATISDFATLTFLDKMLWGTRHEMLHESELALAWTPEMTPEKLDITTSAIEKRDTPELRQGTLAFIDNYDTERQSFTLTDHNPQPIAIPSPVAPAPVVATPAPQTKPRAKSTAPKRPVRKLP